MPPLPTPLSDLLGEETTYKGNPLAFTLVRLALDLSSKDLPLSTNLAASFDLVVASKYYQYVAPENWYWCERSNLDFYPIHNACPYCVLEGRFVQHDGHKPGSGQIGPATAEALREVLASYYHLTNRQAISICSGKEPIDLAIVDSKEKNIFIAEVKASPLFTPPLAIDHTKKSMKTTRSLPLKHSVGIARTLHQSKVHLFLPEPGGGYKLLTLGKGSVGGEGGLERAMAGVLKRDTSFVASFFRAWRAMWRAYCDKDMSDPVYWFTGACSLPISPGEGWPKTSDGKPKGTVSDGKTSVGMDRTDDIKKGTYQVLKLGVETRKTDMGKWSLKIGLASNLHAARHYPTYVAPYEDIVWGWAREEQNPEALYNLFDGIVAFSRTHTRDQWLRALVDWTKEDES